MSGVQGIPFHFARYVNGVEMAEGICIERGQTFEAAAQRAAQLAPKTPGTILVLTGPDPLELVKALAPFAACVEYIRPDEDDEEWAKFRLLVADYRRAAAAFAKALGYTALTGDAA